MITKRWAPAVLLGAADGGVRGLRRPVDGRRAVEHSDDRPVSTPTPHRRRPDLCQPAFTADALPDVGTAAGGVLGLKAATSAVHPGYDRVVFTFGGSAQPGWRVEYVADSDL